MSVVEFVGPPWVKELMSGKMICEDNNTTVMTRKTIVGESSGKVTLRNTCHRFAPSTAAAS